MSTMIEKVARAICAATPGTGNVEEHFSGDQSSPHSARKFWMSMARAALEAMRNHTPVMDSAGYDAYPESAISTGVDHLDIYRAMIDAALKEGK